MDIARQLKQGINSGELVFGQRQTVSHCTKGGAKLVLVASNCPESFIDEFEELASVSTNSSGYHGKSTAWSCMWKAIPCQLPVRNRSGTERSTAVSPKRLS